MIEILSRPSTETLNDMYDAPAATESNVQPEQYERPEIRSSAAERVRNVAGKVAGWLENRALKKARNRAHDEALAEYRDTDRDGFRDQVNALADSSDVSVRANLYGETHAAYENTRKGVLDTKEAVVNTVEHAYSTVKGVGVAALEIGVGASLLGIDAAKAGAEKITDAASDGKEVAGDYAEVLRQRVADLREKSLTRKYARHAKWNKFKNSAKERLSSIKNSASEFVDNKREAARGKIERGKASIDTRRAAGRAALDAYRQTKEAHDDQNTVS